MKSGIANSKSLKNKEINSSHLSIYQVDGNELDYKFKKLELLVTKLSSQNEILLKRIDDLEAKSSRKFLKSNSLKSFSTLNNTQADSEFFEEFSNAKITVETHEWKKDIEKSIQTISERVANNNSNVLMTLLEKRINDMNNEMSKLKYAIDEIIDHTVIIKEKVGKYDKTETKISGLVTQMAEMKNSNSRWQAECLKNLKEFDQKLIQQEISLEQCNKFENTMNLMFENSNLEIKNFHNCYKNKVEEFDNRLNEKTKKFDEIYKYLYDDNLKINNMFKDEISKIEISIKTLWDSFALLTSMINNK